MEMTAEEFEEYRMRVLLGWEDAIKDSHGGFLETSSESSSAIMDPAPAHYAGKVTPWDLEKCMKTSGNAFVDARRTDAIEYCFRIKGDLIGDLRKAKHCLEEAISILEEL